MYVEKPITKLRSRRSEAVINHLDRALERYLREQVPLPESTIGVSFDPPDKDWGAALNRPTVNVFLWHVERAVAASPTGLAQREGTNGIERRSTNPAVEFHYLLTAWASDVKDEHQVLGSVLSTLLRHGVLPDDLLPEGFADGKCRISLGTSEQRVPGEFWSALGGRLKPGLQLKITVPVPVHDWVAAAAPPTSIEVGLDPSGPVKPATPTPAGGWESSGTRTPRRTRRNGVVTAEGRPAPRPESSDPS
jgi:hypothetical protein